MDEPAASLDDSSDAEDDDLVVGPTAELAVAREFVIRRGNEYAASRLIDLLDFDNRLGADVISADYLDNLVIPDHWRGIVSYVWSTTEHPADFLDDDVWRDLFRAEGYTEDGRSGSKPTKLLRVYRGCTVEAVHGMSWTDDFEVAHAYAVSSSDWGPSKLYEADVEPSAILAYLGYASGRESEVVLDPDALDDLDIRPLAVSFDGVT